MIGMRSTDVIEMRLMMSDLDRKVAEAFLQYNYIVCLMFGCQYVDKKYHHVDGSSWEAWDGKCCRCGGERPANFYGMGIIESLTKDALDERDKEVERDR